MKKLAKTLIPSIIGVGLFLSSSGLIFGQANTPVPDIDLQPTGIPIITAQSFISGAISLVLLIAALAFFFTLVIGGIQWILSGGDKTGAESARKRITGAIVGLAIVFSAWAIASLIEKLFNFSILKLTIPQLYKQ